MKYIFVIMILVGQCFAGFKLGLDFSSQFESDYIDTQIDNGIVVSYENMFNSNWGAGYDYLLSTEIDYNNIEVRIFDLYIIRHFFSDEKISLNGKVGYSFLDFEWENIYDINDGIMYGFDVSFFNEVQISYSIHKSTVIHQILQDPTAYITGYDDSIIKNNIRCNRLTLFYLF